MPYPSRIPLKGVRNTRDLGGFPLAGGKMVSPHRLLRSGALASLTAEDRALLTGEFHLQTVIDFRTRVERLEQPDPLIPGVVFRMCPIFEESAPGITREQRAGGQMAHQMLTDMKNRGLSATAYMAHMYQELILSDHSRQQYRSFFNLLSEQEGGAVLWHCTAGKDRVGVGTALLLLALGGSYEDVMADYLLTGEYLQEEAELLLCRMEPFLDTDALSCMRAMLGVRADYLGAAIDAMQEYSGSVDAYLSGQMGLTPPQRDRLRALFAVPE